MREIPKIFIAGHRKAATTMLLNLFDQHPSIAVYPTDINMLYGYFPQYIGGKYSDKERLERLHKILFDDLYNFNIFRKEDDIEHFRKLFFEYIAGKDLNDMRILISALISAFREVEKLDGSQLQYCMLKETSLEVYASEILQWFPDSRFIHLVRDPRDNYAAIRAGVKRYRSFGDDEKTLLFSMLNRGLLGMKMALANQRCFGEQRYKIIRFEDIVSSPKDILNEICDWLEIDFSDNLLTPTVLGQPTKGNNYDKMNFYKISSKNLGRWRERITDDEAAIIEFYFADEMDQFNYKREFSEADTLKPVAEFYKWMNYQYFFFDRFAENIDKR